MGDPKNPRRTQFSLPPGCRFYPLEEQVLCYYITNKNNRTDDGDGGGDDDCPSGFNVIKLIDLYNYDPFDLLEIACFSYGYKDRRRHWYCYTARVVNERAMRKTGSGYWKRRGRVRDVVGRGGHVVLGMRTSFVFYLGNSPKSAVRTDWVMYEYTLLDRLKVRSPRLNCGSALFMDPVSTEHLVSILEDDYIELDDLICPLLGSNNIG